MARKVKVDMTGVESYQKASEGSHIAKIIKADQKVSQGGGDMIVVTFEVTAGEDKGCRVFENYPLVETALWKLKSLLDAVGLKSEGKLVIDLDALENNRVCIIEVFHDEYNGVKRAKVSEVRKLTSSAVDEDEDDDDEDEKPAPKKPAKKAAPEKKTTKKKPDPEPEDDDDDWDEDDEDDDEPPVKSKKAAPAKADKKIPAKSAKKKPDPEPDEDDDDDDDWDEDDD